MDERSKHDTTCSIPVFVPTNAAPPAEVVGGRCQVASSVEAATSDPNHIRGVKPLFAGSDLEFDLLPFG